MAKGTITRKEVIEDDALHWGEEYANQIKKAIKAQAELLKLAKEMIGIYNQYRKAQNNADFVAAKQAEYIEMLKTINALKAYEQAMLSSEKIKQALLKTKKAEIDLENQAQANKKKSIELTSEEIVNQGILARNAKNHALANSKLATEYEKLTAKTRLAATALQNILIAGKKADETTEQYNRRLRQAQTEFDRLQAKVVLANRAIGRFNDNVGNYPKEAAKAIRELIQAFGLAGGIATFVSITKDAFNIVKDFEEEMVNLAAVAGYTRAEVAPLEEEIRKVAKASINSATDVAKLATELIKLGSTPEEAMKLLEPINNLSIALRASAEDSASLVKGLLNAYQEGAEEATRFTDVLAESANRSALDFQGLKDSFSYLAPTAKVLNISIERTAAMLGILADNNIRAESAGRLTSTSFIRLAKNGMGYEEALDKINKAQKENRSELEILALAGKLFGAEAAKIGIILANNRDKIDESTNAYENSAGALQELTDKQLKSLSSELKILDSSWEEYILNVNDANNGTQILSGGVRFLSSNLNTIINIVVFATTAWLAYKASLLLANIQTRLLAINVASATTAQTAQVTVTGFATAAQVSNATATTVATTAWQRFNIALKANLLGLIVTALVLAIYYMNKFSVSLKETTDETQKSTDAFLRSKDATVKNNNALNTLLSRHQELKKKINLTTAEQKELNEITQELGKTVPDATTKMGKYGEALEISSDKIKAFVALQKEVLKLQNNAKLQESEELLKKLTKEQERLNFKNKESVGLQNSNGLIVTRVNGVLKTRSNILQDFRNLTEEELLLYKKKQLEVETDIAKTLMQIRALKGLTNAQIEANKAKGGGSTVEENGKRTIGIIDAEIKAQEDLISTLSDKSGKEGNAVKAKIIALQAERELIYSTEKADKSSTNKRLENLKKVRDAIYQLSQFRYSREIENNQKILDDEKSSLDERLAAYTKILDIKELKNKETLEKELMDNYLQKEGLDKLSKSELEKYVKNKEARVKLLNDQKIAVKDMTASELLIYEKYEFEKKNIAEKAVKDQQALIDAEVDRVHKKLEEEASLFERFENIELTEENERYRKLLDAGFRSDKLREKAVEDHEKNVMQIKNKYAKLDLQNQIDELEGFLKNDDSKFYFERMSVKRREEILNELAELRRKNGDKDVELTEVTEEKKAEIIKESKEKLKELEVELFDSLVDLSNTLLDTRIQNIDNEIQKVQEKYDFEREAAEGDASQQKLLQLQYEKDRKALEDKKRKEQIKQAIFNKAMQATQVTISTIGAVMTALRDVPKVDYGVSAGLLAGAYAAIGAVQLANVLAAPLPKYEKGTKNRPHPGGPALVGEKRPEVINEPGKDPYIIRSKTILNLAKGTEVIPSIDEYNKLQRASFMASLQMEGKKLNDYQASQVFEKTYGKELLEEMILTRKAILNNKQNIIVNVPKIDIPHEIWKSKNTSWN